MSHSQRVGRRDANERPIIGALRGAGCSVFQLDHPCDLLVGRIGQNYLLEVKTPGKKLTKVQREFHRDYRGRIFVVESPEDALCAVGLHATL